MGTGFISIHALPAVQKDIPNSPIAEKAEIEHPLEGIVRREMVYMIGREDVPEEVSPQLFRLHFYRQIGPDGKPIKDSYDFTRGPVTNYERLIGEKY